MKAIAIIMIIAVSVAGNYQKSISQCHMMNMNHSEHNAQANAAVPAGTPAADSSKTMYTCSMHPEIKSAQPGNCPKCGMALIAVKYEVKAEAKTVFQCPMKCEGDKMYGKAGSCPKCGMALQEMKK